MRLGGPAVFFLQLIQLGLQRDIGGGPSLAMLCLEHMVLCVMDDFVLFGLGLGGRAVDE